LPRLVRRDFSFTFSGAPEAVWSAMADTARYNEAAGLPKHKVTETPRPDGSIAFLAQARMGPFDLEWEDLPCNWVRGRWVEHRRRFSRGPIEVLNARLDVTPTDQGCRGDYRAEVAPRGLAGWALLVGGFLRSAERMFMRLAAQADRFVRGEQAVPFATAPKPLKAEARQRLDRLARELEESAYGHGLAQRLAREIAEGLEVDVERLRPLALARLWGVPERHAVEACLEATRLGMLELRWDLLCPRCRGAKAVAASLDRLPTGAHCGTCNVDYGRDFSRNVELTFRPAATIRPIESGEFCLLGPMSTPHIWAHVTLEPGEEREIGFAAPPGPYRLRTLEAGPETDIEHDGEAFPAVTVAAEGVVDGEPSPKGQAILRNRTDHRRTVVIEERRWVRDALTADRVATLQAFRDLFSDEVLRPGDEVAIRRVTLLFSDLKGSTALYDAVGDAAAYRLVREHFAYLAGIVREHDGAIVKTIGDAVMAAFHDPLQGLAAAIAMQRRVASFNAATGTPVVLKVGLHEGPCIAVNLNDRLDYFGGAVNLAARLQGESRGGDVVLSEALAGLPGADGLLSPHAPRAETARLRGFSSPVPFVRLAVGGTRAESLGGARPEEDGGRAEQVPPIQAAALHQPEP
jgi:class 3 adenylate cyclase